MLFRSLDRGLDVGVTSDIDGDPRPQGLAPDCGADEYPSGVTTTPTPTSSPSVTPSPTVTWTPTLTPSATPSATRPPGGGGRIALPLVLRG